MKKAVLRALIGTGFLISSVPAMADWISYRDCIWECPVTTHCSKEEYPAPATPMSKTPFCNDGDNHPPEASCAAECKGQFIDEAPSCKSDINCEIGTECRYGVCVEN